MLFLYHSTVSRTNCFTAALVVMSSAASSKVQNQEARFSYLWKLAVHFAITNPKLAQSLR